MTESRITVSTSRAALATRKPMAAEDVTKAFFARRAASTIVSYQADLKLLERWLGLDAPEPGVNALAAYLFASSPGVLNALLMEWVDEQVKAKLAPYTINRRLTAVRSLVKLGRTLGLINWALDVQGIRGAQGVRDMRGPDPLGIKALFRVATARGARTLSIMHLLYTRGMRSIELRELKLEHLLLDKSEVLIRGKGKTGLKPITVSTRTVHALKAWVAQRGDAPGYVFPGRFSYDTQVSHRWLWGEVKKVGKLAGVQVRPHGLRHSAITAVLDAIDGNVREAQKFSRHRNPAVLLNHYDDARTDVGGKLTRMLDGEKDDE